ncbi:MAG: SusC/RagA family TonB-linked outer membrane protein [Candidatus Cyclobacteriaceae bacterium M3_2C_046]
MLIQVLLLNNTIAANDSYGLNKEAAQNQTVSGKVIEGDTGEPLPGVNIVQKGTNNGTVTDVDGNYSLEIPQDATLVYSSVGYTTQEIPVNNRSVIDLTMRTDVKQLEELVVVGYGTQQEKELTSAITTIDSEEILETPTSQPMQALQGRVAGVQIVSNGAPGASPTVRVRGIGSFEGNAAPLYVVDGMFFDNIDFLNPNDIETISILKDASAAAIYGVRAANGVVLIETKSGAYGQEPEIVYDGYYGIQNPQNVLQMANAEQFIQYVNETGDPADLSFVQNAMQRYGRSRINPEVTAVNTDWYDAIMSPATIQNHSLSVNGGSENTRFSIGGSYFEQEGLLDHTRNEFKRLTFRLKMDNNVNEWLQIGGNANVTASRQYVGDNAAWFRAYFAVPIMPVYDSLSGAEPYPISNAQTIGYRSNQNPLYSLLYNDDRNDVGQVTGNVYLDFNILPQFQDKLTFRTSYSYKLRGFSARNVDFAFDDAVTEVVSGLRRENQTSFDQIWDNYLTFKDYFGPHGLTIVGGYSYRSEFQEILFARGEELSPNPSYDKQYLWYLSRSLNIDETSVGDTNGSYTLNGRLFYQSLFSRVAYNYDERYLVYGTYRRDGNNKFQKKWGDFFTFGLGWVITEEDWFNVNNLDFIKLRGSWGQLGNDAIAPSVGAVTLEETETAINDVLVAGRRLVPIYDLVEQWETTEELNLGISSRLFENKLSLEVDYFIRDTKNLAVSIEQPVFRGSERRSVGEIRNTGLEVSLNWTDNISERFSYVIGGNFTTLHNEVRSLGGAEGLNAGMAEFRQISLIGQPYQAFYGYEVQGVFQNESQINNSGYTQEFINENNLVPGDFYYEDQNNDGIINDQDRVVLGSFIPDYTYGFKIGLNFSNWEFSSNFQGQIGHEILNRKRGEIIFTNDTNLDAELINNLWRGEGTSNRYPSAAGLRKGWNQNMSSYFVEDGSYFRIQNVRLSYNFGEILGNDIPRTKLTLTAERPLTLFGYNGFNPEVPDGIDRQVYPIPAIYTLGLNVAL